MRDIHSTEDIVRALAGIWTASQGGRGDRPEYWAGFDAALGAVAVALDALDFENVVLQIKSRGDLDGRLRFVVVPVR